jgi:hypothetical protein
MHSNPIPNQVRNHPDQPGQSGNYAPLMQPKGHTFMRKSPQIMVGLYISVIAGIVLCAVIFLPLLTYQQSIVGTWTLVSTWTLAEGRNFGDPALCMREFGAGGQVEFRTDGSAMSEGAKLEYSILASRRIELSPYGGHDYDFSLSGNALELMNTGDYNFCIYQRSSWQ